MKNKESKKGILDFLLEGSNNLASNIVKSGSFRLCTIMVSVIVLTGILITNGCSGPSEFDKTVVEGHAYAANSPLSNATVTVYSPEGDLLGTASSEQDGYYKVEDVPIYEFYTATAEKETTEGSEPVWNLSGQGSAFECDITPFTTLAVLLADYDDIRYGEAKTELFDWLDIDKDPFVAVHYSDSLSDVNLDIINYAIQFDPEGVQGWAEKVLGAYVRGTEPNEMWQESGGLLQGGGMPYEEEQAQLVWEEALKRERGGTFVAEIQMFLTEQNGRKSERKLTYYRQEQDLTNRDIFIHFRAPADIINSSYLTQMHSGLAKNWVYFSSFKKIRKIIRSDYSNPFFDSDFTYEDIAFYTQGTYTASGLTETKYSGELAFTVDIVKNDEYTGYSHAEVTILKDTWIIVKSVMFDQNEPKNAVKQLTFTDYEEIQGIQTSMKITMENLETGTVTSFETVSAEYNVDIPPETFTTRNMEK